MASLGDGPRGPGGAAKAPLDAMHDRPMLEDDRGPNDCPYPKAKFHDLLRAFEKGIVCDVFASIERAMANLVVALMRDYPFSATRILVTAATKRQLDAFDNLLGPCLVAMNMVDTIAVHNHNLGFLRLSTGPECMMALRSVQTSRGITANYIFWLGGHMCDHADFARDALVPAMEFGADIYAMNLLFDEGYERRVHEGAYQHLSSSFRTSNVLATLKVTDMKGEIQSQFARAQRKI